MQGKNFREEFLIPANMRRYNDIGSRNPTLRATTNRGAINWKKLTLKIHRELFRYVYAVDAYVA